MNGKPTGLTPSRIDRFEPGFEMKKIAFLGLGNMGGPMAQNLLRAGYPMKVFDIDPDKIRVHLDLGADEAESAPEAVQDADFVMTSLPGPAELESLVLGENNILNSMKKGSVWIDLSTNNLDVERKIRKLADNQKIHTLDAPVTGGTEAAESGNLCVLVGGEEKIFHECREIFEVIGKDIKYLGDHGAGYVAKIAQVILCYLHSVALSEAMMLGVKGGLKPEMMLDIIQNSTGRSYVSDRYGPPILSGSYDPGFALGLAHKDMKLSMELARSLDAELPMCEMVEDLYKRAVEKYGFDQNHLMAVKLLEEANQTFLRGS